MNEQILDTPFKDSFFDFLEKGETIIWQEQPSLNTAFHGGFNAGPSDYDNHFFWAVSILGTAYLIFITKVLVIAIVFLSGLLFFGKLLPMWERRQKNSIEYAITQKQLLFQFKNPWSNKSACYSIPLSEIKTIIVIKKYDIERLKAEYRAEYDATLTTYDKEGLDKIGTIFISTQHPELVPFETKELSTNNKRHQPTMESLDNVEEVAALIKKQMKNLRY